MAERKVIKDKVTAGEYQLCSVCGRICWEWMNGELAIELYKTPVADQETTE